jgi:hypothetical protein
MLAAAKAGGDMQKTLYPVVAAAAAGLAAWLVSQSLATTIGAAIGAGIGVWLVRDRIAPKS